MIYTDRDDAKEFFIARIAAQAQLQGEPLSDLESRMLKWTEVHPIRGIAPEGLPTLQEEFSTKYDDAEFEQRIVELLRAAHASDVAQFDEDYRFAYQVLSKEDHYLNIMLTTALGQKLRKKWLGVF